MEHLESEETEGRQKLHDTRHNFISSIAQNMDLYGLSETNGRLYGTILFSDKPMTLDDMSQALEMSKTSMSTGVRSLTEAGMLSRVWEKGVRKDLYQTDDDWYKSFTSIFVNRWRESTDKNKNAAVKAKSELEFLFQITGKGSLREEIQKDLEILDQAVRYYSWLNEVINLFENGGIFDIIPKK
ncbi:GbsR/MarR family transcriptional regulator [Alteribacillus iranensis]|uniref:HTH-type transcriptional regulator n=1 Tax=Alteribacillus iranensis TaxID=930128 RepID=A0A1I2B1M7_9BACI|nr:GbsR/MarR family transcriptional regulator [Alteribacillus iranensis]SFE49949.1 DNA-binding transcriptional regulator GbsR, MarR family [Alteribacillus iranensis]